MHSYILRARSSYLNRKLGPPLNLKVGTPLLLLLMPFSCKAMACVDINQPGQSRVIELNDEDPLIVQLLLDYMYRGDYAYLRGIPTPSAPRMRRWDC